MDHVYVIIIAIVAIVVAACVREVLRLRKFLHEEKEKRLQEQAEKSRMKIDSVLSGFDGERRNILEFSPEYNKIKDEEKETRDRLLKEVLEKVYAEEQRTKKRLEQDVVQEIIRDVVRNFRHSVYQRMNRPKLKEEKFKKRLVSKSNIAKEKEKRNEQSKENEKKRQDEQRRREQDSEREQQRQQEQRQQEERRQKDEEKASKERLEKERRQQEDARQKILQKRGVENSEKQSAKASETHVSEVEIKPEGLSVSKVASETGKAASKASGGR